MASALPKHIGYQNLASLQADDVVLFEFKANKELKVHVDFNFIDKEIRLRFKSKDKDGHSERIYATDMIESLDLSQSSDKELHAKITLRDDAEPKVAGDNSLPILQQIKGAKVIRIKGKFKVDQLLQNAREIEKSLGSSLETALEGLSLDTKPKDDLAERLEQREQAMPAPSKFDSDQAYREVYSSGLKTDTEAEKVQRDALQCEAMLSAEEDIDKVTGKPTGNWYYHVIPTGVDNWKPQGSQKFNVTAATSQWNTEAAQRCNKYFVKGRSTEAYLLEDNDKDSQFSLLTTSAFTGDVAETEWVTLTPVADDRAGAILLETVSSIDKTSIIYKHLVNPTAPEKAEIFPSNTTRIDPETLPQVKLLNKSQRVAFDHAMEYDITIVVGPPGTGKTATIVAVIVYLIKHGLKVLVFAPSNNAADQLALKINQALPGKVMRAFSRTAERKNSSFYKAGIHEAIQKTLSVELQEISFTPAFKKFIEQERDNQENSKSEREMAKEVLSMMAALRRGELGKDGRMELKKKKDTFLEKFWEPFGAVVATPQVSSHRDLCKFKPSYVVGDEVAAASEPSTLIPFDSFADSIKACFLVGDPRQFPPYVHAKSGKGIKSLGVSLHERFINNGWEPKVLRVQYRMHPAISAFCRKFMYADYDLEDGRGEDPRWTKIVEQVRDALKVPHFSPASFLDVVQSEDTSVRKGTSWENPIHADKIKEFVHFLHRQGVTGDEIVVITPYTAQRQLLSQRLRGLTRVVTLDSYQGREKEVTILDMVTSAAPSSFLTDARRINVGTTRAKEILLMVGSRHGIMNLLGWKRESESVMGRVVNLLKRFVQNNLIVTTQANQPLFPTGAGAFTNTLVQGPQQQYKQQRHHFQHRRGRAQHHQHQQRTPSTQQHQLQQQQRSPSTQQHQVQPPQGNPHDHRLQEENTDLRAQIELLKLQLQLGQQQQQGQSSVVPLSAGAPSVKPHSPPLPTALSSTMVSGPTPSPLSVPPVLQQQYHQPQHGAGAFTHTPVRPAVVPPSHPPQPFPMSHAYNTSQYQPQYSYPADNAYHGSHGYSAAPPPSLLQYGAGGFTNSPVNHNAIEAPQTSQPYQMPQYSYPVSNARHGSHGYPAGPPPTHPQQYGGGAFTNTPMQPNTGHPTPQYHYPAGSAYQGPHGYSVGPVPPHPQQQGAGAFTNAPVHPTAGPQQHNPPQYPPQHGAYYGSSYHNAGAPR